MTVDTVEEYWGWSQVESAFENASEESLGRFCSDFGSFLGVSREIVHPVPSGRSGLKRLLQARNDCRRAVMVPAFNCSVVEDAICEAGYQAKTYDFSSPSIRFDWRKICSEIDDSVGVLIITHYFGVPTDFRAVLEHCAYHNVAIIEDCAHTFGGEIAGRPAGTVGDASIFSFNYDKPISLGWGGVVLVNNKIAFPDMVERESQSGSIVRELKLLRQFADSMAMRRKSIPFEQSLAYKIKRRLRLSGPNQWSPNRASSIGSVQAELGRWCLQRYPEVQCTRTRNAEFLASRLKFQTWPVESTVQPAWLRQKVFVNSYENVRRLSKTLQRRGYRVGNFNWPQVLKGHGVSHTKQAFGLAALWLDVPIHQNMDKAALDEVIEVFSSLQNI